jgi:hypothetical protein
MTEILLIVEISVAGISVAESPIVEIDMSRTDTDNATLVSSITPPQDRSYNNYNIFES